MANPVGLQTPATPATRRILSPSGSSLLLLLFFVALAGIMVYAYRTSGSDTGPPITPAQDLSQVLLPFVAIATAIERFWETVFSWYESVAMSASRIIGLAAADAHWIGTEYQAAEKAVTTLVTDLSGKTPGTVDYDKTYAMFQKAESRLLDAQSRVAEGLKAPSYVAIKQAITLLGSLVIGLVISVSAHLTLFRVAGFPLSPVGDVILTGLLIGAGPGPLHQVIGLLQGLRDSVSGLASLAQGTAIKKATEAIGQAEDAATGQTSQHSTGATSIVPLQFALAQAPNPAAPAKSGDPTPPALQAPDQLAPSPPISTLSMHRQAQRLLVGKRS